MLKKRSKRINLYPHVCGLCGNDIPVNSRCLEETYTDENENIRTQWVCKDCEIVRIRFDLFDVPVDDYQRAVDALCTEYGVHGASFPDRQHTLVTVVDPGMMTLAEATKHAHDVALSGGICGGDHRLLAYWLGEYAKMLEEKK